MATAKPVSLAKRKGNSESRAHEAKAVLEQIPVDAKTNEHKTALEMLNLIPLEGKLVLGDAAFCQRDLSRKIREKKGIGSGR